MMGSASLLEELAARYGGTEIRIVHAPCVGACDRAPVAVVGQRQIYRADTARVAEAANAGNNSAHLPDYIELDAYRAGDGYAVWNACRNGERDRDEVIDVVDRSGLRGLGGAGFPTARKWGFLKGTPKPRLIAINADEGEPGTFKDRYCLRRIRTACWKAS